MKTGVSTTEWGSLIFPTRALDEEQLATTQKFNGSSVIPFMCSAMMRHVLYEATPTHCHSNKWRRSCPFVAIVTQWQMSRPFVVIVTKWRWPRSLVGIETKQVMAECDEAAADCHEESSGYGGPYCYSDIIRAKTDCL